MLGNPDKSVLSRMTEMMNHRGPDGSGIFADDDCGLAHSRLAIVDLVGSPQPIYGEGRVCVVNGEIYNYKNLKNPQYNYVTNGDSEVILSLYKGRGSANDHAKWVSKLDGMFAFALWANGQLILARDAVGIKPLFRTIANGSLVFGSEVKLSLIHI